MILAGGLESFSNLPLQVLLHFNKYFYVAWAVAVLIITERNVRSHVVIEFVLSTFFSVLFPHWIFVFIVDTH